MGSGKGKKRKGEREGKKSRVGKGRGGDDRMATDR
jgi:hypothetical protein